MTGRPASRGLILGPRTTIHILLRACPDLGSFLTRRHPVFRRLEDPAAGSAWSRVTTLEDVALAMDVAWRVLAHDIAAEVVRSGGEEPHIAGLGAPAGTSSLRVDEVRAIADDLEAGEPLQSAAERLESLTEDLSDEELAALEEAMAADASWQRKAADAAVRRAVTAPTGDVSGLTLGTGHPLEVLRREGDHLGRVCADLRRLIEPLSVSPTRRDWLTVRSAVERLVAPLSEVERRFRRLRQAWFPALAVYGSDGPAALLGDRQAQALEYLWRLRLALGRDDAALVVETGLRLLDLIDYLIATDQEVLAPLAARYLSPADWAVVREIEDGVGWALAEPPDPWPG
jgi:DUF438 domain-containing protein